MVFATRSLCLAGSNSVLAIKSDRLLASRVAERVPIDPLREPSIGRAGRESRFEIHGLRHHEKTLLGVVSGGQSDTDSIEIRTHMTRRELLERGWPFLIPDLDEIGPSMAGKNVLIEDRRVVAEPLGAAFAQLSLGVLPSIAAPLPEQRAGEKEQDTKRDHRLPTFAG